MTEANTKNVTSSPVAWLNNQFPGQLFTLLNVALIFGVGGVLYLLRTFADPYAPIPLDAVNIGFMAEAWSVALALVVAFFRALRIREERRQNPKLLTLAAVLEVAVLGVLTYRTFLYVPRSHLFEDRQRLYAYITNLSETLPVKINDDVTLKKVAFHTRTLYFYYDLKDEKGFGYNKNMVHDIFLPQACSLFTEHPTDGALVSVVYLFSADQVKFDVVFHHSDCASVKSPAVAPASSAPAPLTPPAPAAIPPVPAGQP